MQNNQSCMCAHLDSRLKHVTHDRGFQRSWEMGILGPLPSPKRFGWLQIHTGVASWGPFPALFALVRCRLGPHWLRVKTDKGLRSAFSI